MILAPLAQSAFRRLYGAQLSSLAGFGLMSVALALLAYDLAGDRAGAVLGIGLGLKMVGKVVAAPIVGAYADRMPRKLSMAGVEILRVGLVAALPFVTEIWQLYVLIVLVSVCEGVFNPAFDAAMPDLFPDQERYAQALSLSRVAYNLENLASPAAAALLLLVTDYQGVFAASAACFVVSAGLVLSARVPEPEARTRGGGGVVSGVTYGVRRYFASAPLRGVLLVYLSVATASAMTIVNTVVYVRDVLGAPDERVPQAMIFVGVGAIIASLSVPRLIKAVSDRALMLGAAAALAVPLGLGALMPGFFGLAALWFVIGLLMGLAMTPAGLVIVRVTVPRDRPAVYGVQYGLTHACWIAAYPLAGWAVVATGFAGSFLILSAIALAAALAARTVWRREEIHVEPSPERAD